MINDGGSGRTLGGEASPERNRFFVEAPAIAPPKGGGAIRGMGEKFGANPVTGTGSMSVPIFTSPGRGGFGPTLVLSYDSAAGNGPFGFGWTVSLPAITRKTDKGLPRYRDADSSDDFLLAGLEDLVPELDADGGVIDRDREGYRVRRYLPRLEGSFARIERWSRPGDTFWRSVSRDNTTTIYGETDASRIVDPADPDRVFSWLTSETYDDKGNAISYEYARENSDRVDRSESCERHRPAGPSANRYLKRIRYGNRDPRTSPADRPQMAWLFEVVFDYGEGHWEGTSANGIRASASAEATWPARPDPFSTYRAGFEVRTYRRCHRVLMFHRFPELGGEPYLVRSTELEYNDLTYGTGEEGPAAEVELAHPGSTRLGSFLRRVVQRGHVQDPGPTLLVRGGARYLSYASRSLPPIEFDYSRAAIDDTVREVDDEGLRNLPQGVDDIGYRWVDLDGEGLPGVLTEQAGTWWYKRNLAAATSPPAAQFGPLERVAMMAAPANLAAGQQLVDLAGNGRLDLVSFGGSLPGYFERTPDAGWERFRSFRSVVNIPFGDPHVRLVDLTGDGHADVLIGEDTVFTWYQSLAKEGFDAAVRVSTVPDEELGPRIVFADQSQAIYLADMSGDGLSDLVRVRNGDVCYWPNLGYGRFGAKVTMSHPPWFDRPDRFDHRRVRLADLDGSGTTDIVYLEAGSVSLYFNRAGNSFAAPRRLRSFPPIDDLASVSVVDLLGNGTACLVWSSSRADVARHPMRYLDLMGGQKPHLLESVRNNLGAETRIAYAPSTRSYLADRRAGTPWATRLPFPVHCVERVTTTDRWRGTVLATSYSYHHGYFDGVEREFRGFGRVEQVDVETFGVATGGGPYVSPDRTLHQPPVKTITWYHTGAAIDGDRLLSRYRAEYFRPSAPNGFREHVLPDPELPGELTPDERREALRACKGAVLRQEVYELDVEALPAHRPVRLYTTAFRTGAIACVQRRAVNRHAVFLATEREAITYHYELDLRIPTDPDPRVSHTFNLRTDRYGNVVQSVAVAYPRGSQHTDLSPPIRAGLEALIAGVQTGDAHVSYSEHRFTTDTIDDPTDYRLPGPWESLTYELTGLQSAGYVTMGDLRALALSDRYPAPGPAPTPVAEIAYHARPGGGVEKRLVEHMRMVYFDDAVTAPRPLGELGRRGLLYESYKMALTDALLAAVFDTRISAAVNTALGTPARSGYLSGAALTARFGAASAGQYWVCSGVAAPDPARFYLPVAYLDPFGNRTEVTYLHDLLVASRTDAALNTTMVERFDFRVLAADRITDINDNTSAVVYDALGLPAAFAVLAAGDSLAGIDSDPAPSTIVDFFTLAYNGTAAATLLGNATARHLYYLGERIEPDGSTTWGHHPAAAANLQRERHVGDLPAGGRLQAAFEYSDGGGAVLVKKTQAEPAPEATALRWIAGGKVVVNNKGKPVKQYEPYFSSNEHRFEELVESGVTSLTYYDAIGRSIRIEAPDGSYSRIEHSPWRMATYDAIDTVGETGNAWYAAHTGLTATPEMQRAAAAALIHTGTPGVTFLDALGRAVIAVLHDRSQYPGDPAPSERRLVTFTKLDAEGKPLWIRDDRGNLVMQYIRPAMADAAPVDATQYAPCYDIAGALLFQHGMDSGDRWMLNDAAGKPMFAWDANERAGQLETRVTGTRYDALHRPTELWLETDGGAAALVERMTYGEGAPGDRARNLRGQLHTHHDQSGSSTVAAYDFAARPLEVLRQLASDGTAAKLDWQIAILDAETFVQNTTYDALGRIRQLYGWHRAADRVAVYEPSYNERGLLASEDLVVRATRTATGHVEGPESQRRTVIAAIAYDAKGQREAVRYANGTQTRFTYDPRTYRLTQLRTTRPGYDPAFPSRVAQFKNAEVVQNLYYTYDPTGNVTEIYDDAFRPAFFANQMIEPAARYTYDALNRLIAATGREHAGIAPPGPAESAPLTPTFPVPRGDPADQRNYTQTYRYDEVGNLIEMAHAPVAGWTRTFEYAAASNRIARTWFGNDTLDATVCAYDTHGNLLNFANVAAADYLQWDHRDMIQVVERGGGGHVYYQYDSGKQRSRKVSYTQNGVKAWERLYLGGTEIYRRYVAGALVEEIESHHVLEGEHRLLLVEDVIRTDRAGATLGPLYRYQYTNHLGSSCLELDAQAGVISYEEYHPFGTSAYRAARGQAEAPKRYRFTGMERDEESGLSYHTARYYAPWLARWMSCDPKGVADGLNIYLYCKNQPITQLDLFGMEAGSVGITNAPRSARLLDEPASVGVSEETSSAVLSAPPEEFWKEWTGLPTWGDLSTLPADERFAFPFGSYDTAVDRSVAAEYAAAQQNYGIAGSGSVVYSGLDKFLAAANGVAYHVRYIFSFVGYFAEHVGGEALGAVGAGVDATERVLPGFKTTLESLQGVPFLGPEFGILARGSFIQARLGFWAAARTVTPSAGVKLFGELSPGWVSYFQQQGRHTLKWTTSEGVSFWTVSGVGGQVGHTEYAGALFLRDSDLLYRGQSLLLQGYIAPCSKSGLSCHSLLDFLARKRGIEITYSTEALAADFGTRNFGTRFYAPDLGFYKKGIGSYIPTPFHHPQVLKDF